MKEKIKTAAMASASAIKANLSRSNGHPAAYQSVEMEEVEQLIADWGSFPRKAAKDTIKKYGPPQEAIPSQLIWYNNGPWKRTRVIREEIPHHFPQPHTDVLENVIDYQVPPHKLEDLARFDGSVYVDRTRGEVSSRCDMEAANMISLNLMHDLVTGKLSVEQARKSHGEITLAYLMDQPAAYAHSLHFEPAEGRTGYRDHSKVQQALLQHTGGKLQKELWQGNRKFMLLPILGLGILLGLSLILGKDNMLPESMDSN